MKSKHRVKNPHLNISFATRLSIVYLAMLLFPLLAITRINYVNYTKTTGEQSIYSNEKSILQTASFIEYKLASIDNIIDIISYDVTVQTILKEGSDYDRDMQGNWFIQRTDIQNFIYNPYITNEITSVRVYPQVGSSSFEETEDFRKLSEENKQEWYNRFDSIELFKNLWIPSTFFNPKVENPSISLVKRIPDFNSINKYIGVIKGEIPQKVFQEIIDKTATTKGTTSALYNSHDEMLAMTGDKKLAKVDTLKKIIAAYSLPFDGTLHEVEFLGEIYQMGIKNIEHSDWTLVSLVHTDDIFSAALVYKAQLFWIVLALFLASIPLSIYTTRTLTNRIRKLQDHIKNSSEQGFKVQPLENGNDEIGQLTVCYDEMATQMQGLLNDQFQLGYQIKNLEFQVLQSTIDPHFLYNSLDMMYWMAIRSKDTEGADMAKALSKFYKLSLGHGQFIVPLASEIEHVETYVEIQNMRFEGKIKLKIHIPKELESCMVFKIMLQPIVENSILHGIREKQDECGTISIKAREKNDMLIISVADDGIGMTEDQIVDLISTTNDKRGYGLWNINERIRLTHGNDYGLRFFSKLGIGTCVFILLPITHG